MTSPEILAIYQANVENLGKPNPSGWAQARCPFHDDHKKSFSIHLETGSWKCFGGCGENGKGSVYDFAALKGINLEKTKPEIIREYNYWDESGNSIYQKVVRDNKSFYWRQRKDGEWENGQGPRRYPYLLKELLSLPPGEPVFIVEGEKCVHTLSSLGVYATTSGAANSWHADLNKWFKDRDVIIWQDNDAPGDLFASSVQKGLKSTAATIRHLHFDDGRVGSDAEDWILQGGTKEKLLESIAALPDIGQNAIQHHIEVVESPVIIWHKLGLAKNNAGMPFNNIDNVLKILEKYDAFKDMVWFDEFHRKIFTKFNCKTPREWTDADYIGLTRVLQGSFGMRNMSVDCVVNSVRLASSKNIHNEPKDWIKSLTWDGKPRVESFFHKAFGAKDDEYTQTISRNFWLSLIARVFSPGCQMDNMVVLEGEQGIGKSRALRILGGQWFMAASESVMSKDFFFLLPGHLIVEIAELDSFRRAEISRIKQVISIPQDTMRAPYGREKENFPRMCIFVGTTNEIEYLKDDTGGRRFWPIKCGIIDHDYIEKNRDQFFAEALHLFQSNMTWWEAPQQAKIEQEYRRMNDPWERIISDFLIGKSQVTSLEILIDAACLSISKDRVNMADQKRVGSILRLIGWEKKQIRLSTGENPKMVWEPKESIKHTFENMQNNEEFDAQEKIPF